MKCIICGTQLDNIDENLFYCPNCNKSFDIIHESSGEVEISESAVQPPEQFESCKMGADAPNKLWRILPFALFMIGIMTFVFMLPAFIINLVMTLKFTEAMRESGCPENFAYERRTCLIFTVLSGITAFSSIIIIGFFLTL